MNYKRIKFKREREQEGQGDWWGLACPSETEDKEEEPWTLIVVGLCKRGTQ